MRYILAALALTMTATAGDAAKKPEVTGLELQQIQSRDIETTFDVAFPAAMTVLQDSGYRIQAADKATGLITALGSAEAKTTFNWWWGLGKKKLVPMVSVFVEGRGKSLTRVRLNFVMSEAKSRNSFSDEKPVTDPAVYKDAFERLEKEIFVRTAMDAPAPAGVTPAAVQSN